jgi:acetamidase/formamidase
MQVGTTTYLPVLVPGALIWTGDSHAKQGNGEIDLDALETAFPELNITITLIKDQPQVNWPLVETPDSWVTVGYALDLNVALDNLKTETVRFLMDSRKISQAAATKVMFDTWNCPITEVTDIVLGAHCIIPKSAKALRSPALPTSDTADYWVTTGSDPDIYKAMKEASLAALYKMSKAMKITIRQAYTLATMELDCRIERYHWGPDKNISCLVPKSIYTKPSVKQLNLAAVEAS